MISLRVSVSLSYVIRSNGLLLCHLLTAICASRHQVSVGSLSLCAIISFVRLLLQVRDLLLEQVVVIGRHVCNVMIIDLLCL